MKADLYTSEGAKNGTVDLPAAIFGIKANVGLMHEALQRQLALGRANTASVKTKTEVAGGGRKPWRQKGTGRARQGSIRSAQWRGGGVIFGPTTERNYEMRMPKKMRRKALFSALSVKAEDKSIIALEAFASEVPKTKAFAGLLAKMECSRRTLVVISANDPVLQRSSRNLPGVKTILAQYLNIHDILSADRVVFLKDAISKTEEIFGDKK
jgi:large subunit ribosomal protein L4